VQLYNFYDNEELPDSSIYTSAADCINISSKKLTESVIRNCHEKGVKVGVWIDLVTGNEKEGK
jgi:hypothetical protein